MSIGRFILSVFLALLAVLIWFAWPVYGFFAHNGEVPLPPFGWQMVEDEAPSTQNIGDAAYAGAGARTLAILEARRQAINAPAISAAVAIRGEIVWTGGSGYADLSSKTPVTADTVFRIGSTAKALTATALARLVDRGSIDLDAPISTYVRDLPNPAWKEMTARQLASHMAGLPHYKENGDLAGLYQTLALRTHYGDLADALEVFDESPLLCEPGSCFHYSTLGTVLLGVVIEAADGKPYLDVMREEVFAPIGMTSTRMAVRRPQAEANHATPYLLDGNRARAWRPVDLSHRLPGGGFASTPSDLARLGSAWLDDDYISPETRAAFWTPQRLNNGEVNEQGYALGFRWREWEVEGAGLARNANHGGVSRGGQSWLLIFPDYEMAIAFNINSNTDEFSEFGGLYEDIFREFALASRGGAEGVAATL